MLMDGSAYDGFTVRKPRRAMALDAKVLVFPDQLTNVRIRNVSESGFSGTTSAIMPIGSQVLLQVPELGEFPAEIRWALGRRFGARFNNGCPQELANLLHHLTEHDATERSPA